MASARLRFVSVHLSASQGLNYVHSEFSRTVARVLERGQPGGGAWPSASEVAPASTSFFESCFGGLKFFVGRRE